VSSVAVLTIAGLARTVFVLPGTLAARMIRCGTLMRKELP
jgi:hypothetical protein